MNELIKYLVVDSLEISDLCISLALSSILGFLIAKLRNNDLNSIGDQTISDNFFLLAPIISLIMIFIGSNMALSIGLIGSLSIIRFRSVVKNNKDMIYLLWVISIGLGCGTFNWFYTLVAFVFLSSIQLLFSRFSKKNKMNEGVILKIKGKDFSSDKVEQLEFDLVDSFPGMRRSFFTSSGDDYSVDFLSTASTSKSLVQFIEQRKERCSIISFSIIELNHD